MNQLLKLDKIGYIVKVKEGNVPGKKVKTILKNISFSIDENEIVGICGESGGGKSTLAKIIAGILTPTSGSLRWESSVLRNISKSSPVQLLFQNNSEVLNPYRKVIDIVEEALKIQGVEGVSLITEREKIFESVGLPGKLIYRKGYELSGGEQQRAALARLLATKPKLLLLDEPFSAQDVESQLNLVGLFRNIKNEYNISLICISHDLRILRNLADRIIIIRNGEIVEAGITENIFNNPEKDYTKFLLKAESYDLTVEEIREN